MGRPDRPASKPDRTLFDDVQRWGSPHSAVPYRATALAQKGLPTMVDATDQKTDWNLGETIAWIRTRDHARVARMWELSEFEAIALALFKFAQLRHWSIDVAYDAAGRMRIAAGSADANNADQPRDSSEAAPAEAGDGGNGVEPDRHDLGPTQELEQPEGSRPDEPASPSRILLDIMQRVQAGKIRMTMLRAAEARSKRSPVPAREAQELELRIAEEEGAPAIAWSRSQGGIAGVSPWFSRADVIRAWPGLSKRTAAVAGAILRHLREISLPERPLTKPEALECCLAKVPNAYPEAFKRAWAQLEASRKRKRGQHGPRAY